MKITSFASATLAPPLRPVPSAAAGIGFHVVAEGPVVGSPALGSVRRSAAADFIAAIGDDERRRQKRQARQNHAGQALDALDGFARGLAMGRIESGALDLLSEALQTGGERSDEPVLEALVDAIELRAAVELAKLKRRSGGLVRPSRRSNQGV